MRFEYVSGEGAHASSFVPVEEVFFAVTVLELGFNGCFAVIILCFALRTKKNHLSLGCLVFWYLQMDCKDVLRWWGSSGKLKFPYLAPVAQQVFGNQAAAAQVERDFSGCGNLLKPDRSRIDTYWVEMVMFLKANYEHIPEHEHIPMVAAKDIRACLPERFTGKDTDLVAAEAAFDVLTNTATPTAGGMSFDED